LAKLRVWILARFGKCGSIDREEVDREITDRFTEVYELAAAGYFDSWQEDAESCLALIIVLDQFPRNMFRSLPQAFATDDRAIELAKLAVDRGYDLQLIPVQRWFIYLPFEHSENIKNQRESIRLFETLADTPDGEYVLSFAKTHLEIIEQFGRFPHRNEILGRLSTPAEKEFLSNPAAFRG
jgi:uncharacterized protein (DUF924 family)